MNNEKRKLLMLWKPNKEEISSGIPGKRLNINNSIAQRIHIIASSILRVLFLNSPNDKKESKKARTNKK